MKLKSCSANVYEKLSDDEIAIMAKSDNTAAEYLIGKYKPVVRACAKTYFLVGADKDDIIQEGMIALAKAIDTFKPSETSFKNFAKMCIKRRIITAIKTCNRNKHIPLNYSYSLDKPVDEGDNNKTLLDLLCVTLNNDPLEKVIGKEETTIFEKILQKELTVLEKKVLILYIDGYSYSDISAKLGTTLKSVDSALTRIKRKLRKNLYEQKKVQ